jgi:hypothetical protein
MRWRHARKSHPQRRRERRAPQNSERVSGTRNEEHLEIKKNCDQPCLITKNRRAKPSFREKSRKARREVIRFCCERGALDA